MNRLERIQRYAFDIRIPVLTDTEITQIKRYLRNPLRTFLYRYQDILSPLIMFNALLLFISIAVDFSSIAMLVVDVVKTLIGQSPDYLIVVAPLTISFMFGVMDVYFTTKIFESVEAYHSSEYLKHPSKKDEYVYLYVAGRRRIPTLFDLTDFLTHNPGYVPYVEKITSTRPLMQGEFNFLQSLAETKKLD